ncbi:MAG TPA: DUF3293 domain-containing protein [Pyrinomonadaceae bacterium]|nr:DUF3293 domain-containing protein [Pyrinomonadaceae bacterium]
MSRSAKLEEAYLRTSYRVEEVEKPFDIRVGQSSPQLENLLATYGATSWAYITAFNPRSIPLSLEENERRHVELLHAAQTLGCRTLVGHGVGDDGVWPPEKSLLILDIDRHTARELGVRFEQNAILVGERGGLPELLAIQSGR